MTENMPADAELRERVKIAKFAIVGELLFVLLPLIVISIVELGQQKTALAIIESPEWSFGAAVLFGQSIMKLVAGFSYTKPKTWEKPVFLIAAITVFGLVPTLVILALLLVLNPVPWGLVLAQVIIFILGAFVFYNFGSAGHVQSHPPNNRFERDAAKDAAPLKRGH